MQLQHLGFVDPQDGVQLTAPDIDLLGSLGALTKVKVSKPAEVEDSVWAERVQQLRAAFRNELPNSAQ